MFANIDEGEQMTLFRAAYQLVKGERLKVVRKSERPDFICERSDGTLVGIEFTIITRDPESSQWAMILDNEEFMDGCDASIMIQAAVANKGAKRGEPDWQLPDSSILVLSVPDCPIGDMETFLEDCRGEFDDSGFSEIWIADHSEVEAYGNVELFCLYPPASWGGYHTWRGKPYG